MTHGMPGTRDGSGQTDGRTDAPGRSAESIIDQQARAIASRMSLARPGEGYYTRLLRTLDDEGRSEFRIELRQAPPEHDEWLAPVRRRAHRIHDIAGILAMATKYGSAERSLILYDDNRVTLVLDETIERGERELLRCDWNFSDDWCAWERLTTGDSLSHKDLLHRLIRQQHNLVDVSLLTAVRSIKARAEVNLDSEIQVGQESVGVAFRVAGDESLMKFPRSFEVQIPVLEQDGDEEDRWVKTRVRVEVVMPSSPTEKIAFALFAPNLALARRKRLGSEIAKLQAVLAGWTIAHGRHSDAED